MKNNVSPLTSHILIHTGQHYDYEMSKVFLEDLGLLEPDIYLRDSAKNSTPDYEFHLSCALSQDKYRDIHIFNALHIIL